MHREITALWQEKKVVLRETPRAVTPFGGLSVFIQFLQKIGYRQQVSQHMPIHLESPNAIHPGETFTAFLISVVAGARRFAHTSLLRADRALHTLLGDEAVSHGRHDPEFVQALYAGDGGAVVRTAVGLASRALAEASAGLQSGFGLDGVRALRGTGRGEERLQPAETGARLTPSVASGVGGSVLHSARLAAQREHGGGARGGGVSKGSAGETGKPGMDTRGAGGLGVLRSKSC